MNLSAIHRTIIRSAAVLVVLLGLTAAPALRADEIGPDTCGRRFSVSGDITHTGMDAPRVAGATDRDMYLEEIYGRNFKATVENLPEGDYTVEIYLAEKWATAAGRRVFDIYHGNDLIVENLDIFAEAGQYQQLVVTRTVRHLDDSINGPLTLTFQARENNAKVNAIVIKSSDGSPVACFNAKQLFNAADLWASEIPQVDEPVVYTDTSQPFDVRIDDLIRRMSLAEKAHQLMNAAPPIERLGIPGYEYWNECLHGVARAGHATVFPQAIGMAAMWDPEMMHTIADTIATEGRAKNNAARAENPSTRRYFGLTFWTPNINIFRDPRWGRGHETYGEDPYLTGRLAVSFIQGLQGDDPKYLKAMACAKHYAVHSGPEKLRHEFDAVVSSRDLWETYLPQFEAAVVEGRVGIVMSVYNALYGVPGPASEFLLTDILRNRWGFSGHVVSDCGAVRDIWQNHKYVETPAEASALAIQAGNDLNCGGTYKALTEAVQKGLVTEADLDVALRRVLMARFQLGLFDTPDQCEFLAIPANMNDTPAHSQVALEAARKSIVLLKNDGLLPLNRSSLKSIAVVGPNADSVAALVGNYNGDPSSPVTILSGIRNVANSTSRDIQVTYAAGCPLALRPNESYSAEDDMAQKALEAARDADVVIFVGGLDATLEGEQMRTDYVGFDGGDRITIELPEPQVTLLKALAATGKPVVFVNLSGSAIALPWAAENIPAIVHAWYPGQNGGTAVADVLFGDVNPAGRLPITFYRSTAELPDFLDYDMESRTYRYFRGEPLFAFGHGLSYTSFEYGSVTVSDPTLRFNRSVRVSVPVKNSGSRAGDEVVQLYVRHIDTPVPQPVHSLAGFQRISLEPGASTTVTFELTDKALRYWNEDVDAYNVPAGRFEVQVGTSSADIRQTLEMKVGE